MTRSEEAEAIVRALAASDPDGTIDFETGSEYTGSWGINGCIHCREEFMGGASDWKHADGCLWKRAREWVRNADAEGAK